jgi:tRNA-dihydrouridine synthase
MLGRGAIADPLLFQRLRDRANPEPGIAERRAEAGSYLRQMRRRYGDIFCGDVQVLCKLKAIVSQMDDPGLAKPLKELRRAKSLSAFEGILAGLR